MTRRRPLVLLNVVSFIGLSAYVFWTNSNQLFVGLDGTYYLEIVREQRVWMSGVAFAANPLQALGDMSFPVNTRLIPAYALSGLESPGPRSLAAAYTIFATELFLSTYLLARALRFSRLIAAASAWIFPLLTLPYWTPSPLYGVLALAPSAGTTIALHSIAIACVATIGRCRSTPVTIGATVVLTGALAAIVFVSPTSILLVAPTLACYSGALVLGSATRAERLAKLGALVTAAVVLWMSGAFTFVRGLVQYSAAALFSQELRDTLPYSLVSIVLHGELVGWTGPVLFALALMGAVMHWRAGTRRRRRLMQCHVLAAVGLVTIGVVGASSQLAWPLPRPLYFEFNLWPMYVVLAVSLLLRLLFIAAPLRKLFSRIGLPAAAIVPWLVAAPAHGGPRPFQWIYPPSPSPMTQVLVRDIALRPNGMFRGRVATFMPSRAAQNWVTQHNFDWATVSNLGNDHRMVGLWYFDIPTLMQYTPTMSPAFYMLATRLLATDQDAQTRSVVVLTVPRTRTLQALGVRFVITTATNLDDPRAQLVTSVWDGDQLLRLFELPEPNVGTYAPTDVTVVRDAAEGVKAMVSDSFDFRTTAIADAPLPGPLTAPTDITLRVEADALRVTGHSDGRSLLLLPFEYSHCRIPSALSGEATVVRVNLAMTGVVFSGTVDLRLPYENGVMRHSGCRLEDLADARRLRFGDVSSPPARR